MDILQYLDASLEFRIRELEEEITKFSAISNHLKDYNELKKKNKKRRTTTKRHEFNSNVDIISNPNINELASSNGLEEILNKAKEIRNTSKTKRNRSNDNNGTKLPVKLTLNSHSVIIDTHELLSKPVDKTDVTEECCLSFINDFQSQLKILAAEEFKNPLNLLSSDKELSILHYKLLNKLGKRISIPKNNVFHMVSYDIRFYNLSKSSIYDVNSLSNSHNLTESVLLSVFKKAQSRFESRLKVRLQSSTFGANKLKDLKIEILENWFRVHRCFQLYDAYISNNLAVEDVNNISILTIINNLFKSTSNVTPYLIGNKSVSALSSDKWHSAIINKVDVYQDIFQNKIKYIAELVIGKYFLKNTIKELKQCCENKLISDKHFNDKLVSQWITTLKSFRDLYCTLVNEVKSSTCCVFVEK